MSFQGLEGLRLEVFRGLRGHSVDAVDTKNRA